MREIQPQRATSSSRGPEFTQAHSQPQGTCFLSTSDLRPPLPPCSRKLHLYKLQFISAILFSKSPCSYGRDIQLHHEGGSLSHPNGLSDEPSHGRPEAFLSSASGTLTNARKETKHTGRRGGAPSVLSCQRISRRHDQSSLPLFERISSFLCFCRNRETRPTSWRRPNRPSQPPAGS